MGANAMMTGAGEVYFASLDRGKGTEQRGSRPVVIISAVQIGTRVIVVPTTTSRRPWPTRVPLELHGVKCDAMCEQVRAVDVARLDPDMYGRVQAEELERIRETVANLIGVYQNR